MSKKCKSETKEFVFVIAISLAISWVFLGAIAAAMQSDLANIRGEKWVRVS